MVRLTNKERGLLKGAIRRVFSRSDLRRQAIEAVTIEHSDPKRPRVKKWGHCSTCGEVVPRYLLEVDHLEPVVPLDKTLESMSWDNLVERLWCDVKGLAAVCKLCHSSKTKAENAIRRSNKK